MKSIRLVYDDSPPTIVVVALEGPVLALPALLLIVLFARNRLGLQDLFFTRASLASSDGLTRYE